jgi:membrane-associated protease RseP (regulator of RpoE activity)
MAISFLIYDLIFLFLFIVFFSSFLYIRRKNIKKEGLLLLYKTSWGIKLINYLGKKYKRTLKFLSYVSIGLGYVLMIGMLYLAYTILKIYLFNPNVVRAIKVPPIIPLVPYLPQVFNLDFLPPFFFTYWIVILAVIAITHEMAHGIFATHNKVRIKTTGFGFFPFFLPVFLAAFVELDEKVMAKKKKFSQMAILSAGTFANVLTAVFFFGVLWLFFSLAFASSGVVFDSYATSTITIAGISSMNGVSLTNPTYDKMLELANEEGFSEIEVEEDKFLITREILEDQAENEGKIIVYNSAPAINENLSSIITEINGVEIMSLDELMTELSKYSPGEEITVGTITEEGEMEKTLILEEHPDKEGSAWLGIGFLGQKRAGFVGKIIDSLSSFKKPNVYYAPVFDGISVFIYNLLWWLILISVSVALINMLPVGIFDGGRFFYLTILALTKSEARAKKWFQFSTYFFLFLLFLLMALWAFSFF